MMSSDRSQTQKATDCMIAFIGHSGEVRIRGIKKKKIQVTGCQGLRVEEEVGYRGAGGNVGGGQTVLPSVSIVWKLPLCM